VLKRDKAVLDAISQIRESVLKDADHVYVKTEDRMIPRFYINTKAQQATLVSNKDGAVDPDDPYNKMVSLVAGIHPQIDTALFKAETKNMFVSVPAKEATERIVRYASKIQKVDLELNESAADEKNLLKILNRFAANRAWNEITGIENVLFTSDSKKTIESHVKSLKGKKREKESRHLDITYRRLLLREVEKLFTVEGSQYAHAIVHGLTIVADESAKHLKDLWIKVLTQNSILRPSWVDIELLGVVPSVKMKNFKNLFTPMEWGVIENSNILSLESEIAEVHKMPLTFDGFMNILTRCKNIRSKLKENEFVEHFLTIKKERLLVCGDLKHAMKKGGKLNMWRELGNQWQSSQRLMNAFGIGRLHSESKALPGISWQTLNNQLVWDAPSETWVIRDLNSVDLRLPLALSLVTEFVNLINR